MEKVQLYICLMVVKQIERELAHARKGAGCAHLVPSKESVPCVAAIAALCTEEGEWDAFLIESTHLTCDEKSRPHTARSKRHMVAALQRFLADLTTPKQIKN